MVSRRIQRLTDLLIRPLVNPPAGLERIGYRVAVLGFWFLLGSLEAVKELVVGAIRGATPPIDQAILVNFPWWFFWAGGTLLVTALAQRFPLEGPRRLASFLVHGIVALGIAIIHLSLVGAFIYYTFARGAPVSLDTLSEQIRYWLGAYLVIDFFVYWMVLAGYHGFLYHQRYLQGRLREAEAQGVAAGLAATAAEAKLQALRMELDPHFLFNALNSVASLVEDGRRADATTMLDQLSRLLRITLSRGREKEIDLADEIDHIRQYLDIEGIRFGEWLTATVQMGPGVEGALVPPMILLPVVENAVVHGVSRVPGDASIQVSAMVEDDWIRLTVRDNGPGPVLPIQEGTGLRNLKHRLKIAYGPSASFSLQPCGDSGCIAVIRFPLRRAGDVSKMQQADDRSDPSSPPQWPSRTSMKADR